MIVLSGRRLCVPASPGSLPSGALVRMRSYTDVPFISKLYQLVGLSARRAPNGQSFESHQVFKLSFLLHPNEVLLSLLPKPIYSQICSIRHHRSADDLGHGNSACLIIETQLPEIGFYAKRGGPNTVSFPTPASGLIKFDIDKKLRWRKSG